MMNILFKFPPIRKTFTAIVFLPTLAENKGSFLNALLNEKKALTQIVRIIENLEKNDFSENELQTAFQIKEKLGRKLEALEIEDEDENNNESTDSSNTDTSQYQLDPNENNLLINSIQFSKANEEIDHEKEKIPIASLEISQNSLVLIVSFNLRKGFIIQLEEIAQLQHKPPISPEISEKFTCQVHKNEKITHFCRQCAKMICAFEFVPNENNESSGCAKHIDKVVSISKYQKEIENHAEEQINQLKKLNSAISETNEIIDEEVKELTEKKNFNLKNASRISEAIKEIVEIINKKNQMDIDFLRMEKLQNMMPKSKELIESVKIEKNDKLPNLRKEMELKNSELSQKNQELLTKLQEMIQKIQELSQKNQESSKKNQEFEKMVNELNSKIEELNKKYQESDSKIQEAYQENIELTQKISDISSKNKDLLQKNQEMEKKEQKLIDKNETMAEQQKQFSQINQELIQKNKELTQEFNSTKRDLLQKIEEMKKDSNPRRPSVHSDEAPRSFETKKREFTENLEALSKNMEEIHILKQQIEKYQMIVQENQKDIQNYRSKCKNYEQKISKLKILFEGMKIKGKDSVFNSSETNFSQKIRVALLLCCNQRSLMEDVKKSLEKKNSIGFQVRVTHMRNILDSTAENDFEVETWDDVDVYFVFGVGKPFPAWCGDWLAKQHSNGKGMVMCRGCTREDEEGICGKIEREIPFTKGGDCGGDGKNMMKTYPLHPILNGVQKFNGGTYSARARIKVSESKKNEIVSLIAQWDDMEKTPMIITKYYLNSKEKMGNIVALNLWPVSNQNRADYWEVDKSDGEKILQNSCAWASKTFQFEKTEEQVELERKEIEKKLEEEKEKVMIKKIETESKKIWQIMKDVIRDS